ncbi:hypothetical protein BaRGS_00035440 [Batillaria attramentaria]|uniref:RNase H type-1 domain-containing protein n=1 Tax=Batillaria attramentaria TaxID=370345 RepID=A0ABD0JEQ3_9CAEN
MGDIVFVCEHQDSIPSSTLPLDPSDLPQPWTEDHSTLHISTSVPYRYVTLRDSQDDIAKCALTLTMLAEQYMEESWIHVYTDGCATDAVANGGARIFKFPEGDTSTLGIPTGKHCSNYMAEVQALMQATTMIQDSNSKCHQTVFLTDALSVLEALAGDKLPCLMEKLQNIARTR